jgi:hypothetical protein
VEIVLEGDRGQRLVFRLDRLMFLGFQRLMQALRITAAGIMRPVNSSMITTSPSRTM